MNRILVIGDLLTDRYRFLKPLRSDPANNVALVVESEREEMVDGGAGNLVRNLESLCNAKINFFHASHFRSLPMKIRYYVDDRFILREDREDVIKHDEEVIDEFVDLIEPDDFVVISDYHKGTIEGADIVRIISRCDELENVTTFADTNHVFPEHVSVNWLKINLETAKGCIRSPSLSEPNMARIISEKNNSNVIITKGEDGFIAYLKELDQLIVLTKDKNKDFVDAIGAGDTFLAGLVSYLARHNTGELPALVYADIVAHLSTSQLGTLDVVTAEAADKEYKNAKTSIEETEDTLHVYRTIIDDKRRV